jgi:hypothetical protein
VHSSFEAVGTLIEHAFIVQYKCTKYKAQNSIFQKNPTRTNPIG